MKSFRPTLAQTFLAANVCLAALLGALIYGLSRASEQAVLATSEQLRRATSQLIVERVQAYFDVAERLVTSVESQMRLGLADPRDPRAVEAVLFRAGIDLPALAGSSFTVARSLGWDDDGTMRLAPDDHWQMAVYREGTDIGGALDTGWVRARAGGYVREVWRRERGAGLHDTVFDKGATHEVQDPTTSLTFVTPASRPHFGSGVTLWSDLSFLEADAQLPEPQRRVVINALRALRDRTGGFAGVLRLGLRTETIDRIVHEEGERARPNRIVLCDEAGRLVSRLSPTDPLVEEEGSLRVVPPHLPEEIALALRDDSLRQVSEDHPESHGRFSAGGRPFLASYSTLPRSQGWRVVVVVAEDELPGWAEMAHRRRVVLGFVLLVSAIILVGGILTLRTVRHGIGQVAGSSKRLREFDFTAGRPSTFFRDIQEALQGLELAKTAMRAMSKYVPVDLVRHLYQTGKEPELGGELMPVSLLFSDIKGFTTLAERLPPNELARLLGRYFEVMSAAVQKCGGTIDKYIGDAIMAIWNAPSPTVDHARRACEATLAAQAAGEALFASPEWEGRPPLVTRFGLHTGEVLVGHFGAPDRLSYTCLGDGVNLAARLEGLNKQYGTTLLASDAVREAVGAAFEFRFLDVVAVSGKGQAVRVYELLGPAGASGPRVERARAYEAALALYLGRDFVRALAAFEAIAAEDPPAAVLASRCRGYLEEPPPPEWDGTYVAKTK